MKNATEKGLGGPVWRSWPFLVGYCLTAVFILFWTMIASSSPSSSDECLTNLCVLWNSKPNEVGDTFAGLFGSLAFVWIIVTVLVQGLELREQRIEIKAGREAQEAQAQALALQTTILANQNVALQEQRHDRLVEALVASVRQTLGDLIPAFMTWEIKFRDDEGKEQTKTLQPFVLEDQGQSDERFLWLATQLAGTWASLVVGRDFLGDQYEGEEGRIIKKPLRTHIHRALLDKLEQILQEKENCSAQMKVEIERLAVSQFKREYERLMSIDSYWSGDFDPHGYNESSAQE